MTEAVRIFIGCASNNEDLESQIVLHYTLHKYASQPLDITWMQLSRDSKSPFFSNPQERQGWNTTRWATPFSGFRWAVPALCSYAGKAIYFDSDFIVRGDIAELWNTPITDNRLAVANGANRMCCSLWDCAQFPKIIPDTLSQMMAKVDTHSAMQARIPAKLIQPFAGGDWNVYDIVPFNINSPTIKGIHYTQIHTQLQLPRALKRLASEGGQHWYRRPTKPHPRVELQQLFDAEYEAAIAAGYSVEQFRKPAYGEYKIR